MPDPFDDDELRKWLENNPPSPMDPEMVTDSPRFDMLGCTCVHEDFRHGLDGCDVPRCPCRARWEFLQETG